jgi:hypothetical protein
MNEEDIRNRSLDQVPGWRVYSAGNSLEDQLCSGLAGLQGMVRWASGRGAFSSGGSNRRGSKCTMYDRARADKAWKRPVADRPWPNEIPQEEAIQQVVLSGRGF